MTYRLLSVDWDYFFPVYPFDPKLWALYDWGMKDSAFHRDSSMWLNRGAGFLMNDLPLPDTTGLERTFWSRFTFTPKAKLYYGDSHVFAGTLPEANEVDEVWNYDAHHDLGYNGNTADIIEKRQVFCDNWLGFYSYYGRKARVFYPRWRPDAVNEEKKPLFKGIRKIDDERPVKVPFDAVYVCRSSAWSPAWLDEKFRTFLLDCPIKVTPESNRQEDYDALTPRQWSMEELNEYVANWVRMREAYAKKLEEART